MELFAYSDRDAARLLAVTEEGVHITCGELNAFSERFAAAVGGRRLVFLLCENTPGTLLGYLACLKTGAVPLLLDAHIAPELLQNLLGTYRPDFVYLPGDLPEETRAVLPRKKPTFSAWGSSLIPAGEKGPELHPELALLLTTSGSTGSPKLVRLSKKNLDANARSIAEYLTLDENERPITCLPMSYSYGMSVVNSHLLVGAPILLTRCSVLEREFWDMVSGEKATSLVGVPYTYQMYHRLGLTAMALPHLRTLTQAGGKLSLALHKEFAAWAAETGRRFFVMYGQTEAGPRMGYLPAERSLDKCGSMGISIPGGKFRLESEEREEITRAGTVGELIYQGPNVAMGYACCAEDLLLGDEWNGELRTGDMAQRDAEGFYYIVGRKKRFLKLFGNRVNLDETERLLAGHFPETAFACVGRDDCLSVFTDGADPELRAAAAAYLADRMRLPLRAFSVRIVEAIPKNEAGKTLYASLENLLDPN